MFKKIGFLLSVKKYTPVGWAAPIKIYYDVDEVLKLYYMMGKAHPTIVIIQTTQKPAKICPYLTEYRSGTSIKPNYVVYNQAFENF